MKASWQTFYKYRFLLQNLIQRDLRVKYRRSKLGIMWSVLNPLLMMCVMSAVFSYMFRFDIEHYAVYLLTGQLLFTFFNESTTNAMGSILFSSALIKKVYVPKYIFPLEKICFAFVNLCFSMIALALVMVFSGVKFYATIPLAVFPIITLFAFSLGVGMFLSAASIFFRDVMHLWSIFTLALMYATPVFYPVSQLQPWMQSLMVLNPMYWYIATFRDVVLYGQLISLNQIIACTVCSVLALVVGLVTFKKGQDKFILYI